MSGPSVEVENPYQKQGNDRHDYHQCMTHNLRHTLSFLKYKQTKSLKYFQPPCTSDFSVCHCTGNY